MVVCRRATVSHVRVWQDIGREFSVALDLGCGPGFIAQELDDHGGFKYLTGLDSSQGMLKRDAEDLKSVKGVLV